MPASSVSAFQLVGLAAQAYKGADMAMDTWIKEIIFTLHEVYETLRQCEEGGYVALQLEYRYDKVSRGPCGVHAERCV